MSPVTQVVYVLVLIGISSGHTKMCSFPLNCGVESSCYIGSSCVCPTGYAQLSMCSGMGVVAEECHEYMAEGLICYPENACLGPDEKWQKTGLLSLVCVRTNNTMSQKARLLDEKKIEHSAQRSHPIILYLAAVVFVLKVIHWATMEDKKGNSSENQTTQTA